LISGKRPRRVKRSTQASVDGRGKATQEGPRIIGPASTRGCSVDLGHANSFRASSVTQASKIAFLEGSNRVDAVPQVFIATGKSVRCGTRRYPAAGIRDRSAEAGTQGLRLSLLSSDRGRSVLWPVPGKPFRGCLEKSGTRGRETQIVIDVEEFSLPDRNVDAVNVTDANCALEGCT